MKICVIGAGWYGVHLACALKKMGYQVTLLEKNAEICSQVSGNFGIRLHKGPHYPRSIKTRENCIRGFDRFSQTYPELLVHHRYSIYGLGEQDAEGNPSKVNPEQFYAVCHESKGCKDIDIPSSGYRELISAVDIEEPSIVVGEQLRLALWRYLEEARVEVVCNFSVQSITKGGCQISVTDGRHTLRFDKVINATGYQSFLPQNVKDNFPFEMEVVYQPCLALEYEDTRPEDKPFSFIVMDGWFPCLMPYVERFEADKLFRRYILTHGSYTILASCKDHREAQKVLDELTDEFVIQHIRSASQGEMIRFWPEFENRFIYRGWRGQVLAKIKTRKEFRSAVTFLTEADGVIHIIPGKVSNIFDAEDETIKLIQNHGCTSSNGYRFVSDGVLAQSQLEIIEKPSEGEPNTCLLDTYEKMRREMSVSASVVPYSLLRPVSSGPAQHTVTTSNDRQLQ